MLLAFLHWVRITLHPRPFVSDIAVFVLKRDVKLQLTNSIFNRCVRLVVPPLPVLSEAGVRLSVCFCLSVHLSHSASSEWCILELWLLQDTNR